MVARLRRLDWGHSQELVVPYALPTPFVAFLDMLFRRIEDRLVTKLALFGRTGE